VPLPDSLSVLRDEAKNEKQKNGGEIAHKPVFQTPLVCGPRLTLLYQDSNLSDRHNNIRNPTKKNGQRHTAGAQQAHPYTPMSI
jgi:hypothetical protein